ncbi:MAG TPA: MerR family transcriptional regulator [Chloroflexota bacterium]|jgi:DNA-binding transcriptional MerR regulator/predicted transcriptional regulator YdeE|nr:MerR family transcriptional regulator [Chloroflexota bacterium]
MFRIGEFSKLAQVPVPTLRFYDQIGLLAPAEIDRSTGYRYYSASQLPRLHRILALKGLGFSLDRIGDVLSNEPTLEHMRGMLRLRHEQLNRDLAEMRSQLAQVETRLRQIEREDQLSRYDVLLKEVPPQLVASVRAVLPSHGAVGELFAAVYEALGEHASPALGPHPGEGGQTLVLWYDAEHKEHDVDGAAAFFLRSRAPDRGRMRVHELPGATMACTIHHGSYDTIGEAHEAVITWIDAHGYRIAGPDREINIYNAQPIRRDDPTYVTEIQYPVSSR